MSNAHYDMAERAKIRHEKLGVPVTALTAIAGTSIFAGLSSTKKLWLQITAGLLSLLAAVLAALHTFLNFSEDSAQHKSAAVELEAVQHRLDVFILALGDASTQPPRELAIKQFAEIGDALQGISAHAPTIPDSVYDAAHPRSRGVTKASEAAPR
jgi:hypothetical protein